MRVTQKHIWQQNVNHYLHFSYTLQVSPPSFFYFSRENKICIFANGQFSRHLFFYEKEKQISRSNRTCFQKKKFVFRKKNLFSKKWENNFDFFFKGKYFHPKKIHSIFFLTKNLIFFFRIIFPIFLSKKCFFLKQSSILAVDCVFFFMEK